MLVHARTHAPIQSTIPINNMRELIVKQGMKLTDDVPWLFLLEGILEGTLSRGSSLKFNRS